MGDQKPQVLLDPGSPQFEPSSESEEGNFIVDGGPYTIAVDEWEALAPKLVNLTLKDCEFTFLPPSIGSLINLTSLDVSVNWITSIPPTFAQLSNLQSMNLSTNDLTFLPNHLFRNMTDLRALNLSDNYIANVLNTGLQRLTNLTFLIADDIELTILPATITRLTSLSTLHIDSLPAVKAFLDRGLTSIHDAESLPAEELRIPYETREVIRVPTLKQIAAKAVLDADVYGDYAEAAGVDGPL